VIVVKVMGGLGNQMFAYAFALALRELGREVKLDSSWHERHEAHQGWELGKIFPLAIPECSEAERDALGDLHDSVMARARRKIFGARPLHRVERGRGYDPSFLKVAGEAYFDGYWQSPRYHEGIEPLIEAAFRFPAGLEPEGEALLTSAAGRALVGVHVRRGDYLEGDKLGGVCGEAYYGRAIAATRDGLVDPVFAFFSDDLDWCRERLGRGLEAIYVDWNRGGDSWRDMRLMTLCDRLVIANSSFSWWGARLGADRGRMIAAPDRWYGVRYRDNKDIAMPGWLRIATEGAS